MILTFGLDSDSFARFAPLRERHFPSHRNFLPVHVTLFQQLPTVAQPRILGALASEAGVQAPAFRATGIIDLGGGAAVDLDCEAGVALQQRLRNVWRDFLSRSDDRKRKLHVTVQNKVDRETAHRTQNTLRADFEPFDGYLDRLILWHYRGGPWERIATVPLARRD